MQKIHKILDDPNVLLDAIPRSLESNIIFRSELHGKMAEDEGMFKAYMELCAKKPQILFNSAFWVYEARALPGKQNVPFILRPKQEFAVERMHYAIDNATEIHPHNLVFDKSREEGASEIICKMFAAYFLMYGDMYFLVGSRVEDFVDKGTSVKDSPLGLKAYGNHKCLFHKILYALCSLPPYMQPALRKSHLLIENLHNNSKIGGEATTDNFGAGDRAKAVLVDECARIEPGIAQYIIDNIQDTTFCAIFNSTHFKWGSGHPYAKLINSNKIEVVTLGWEDNPVKNYGLYKSPDLDIIEISDIDYYRDLCPLVFNDIQAHKPFSYSDLQPKIAEAGSDIQEQFGDIRFVADGGEGNFNCYRSRWFDQQEARGRSRQDIAINILRIPQGSADQFFDDTNLVRIEKKYVRDPDYTGTIKYEIQNKRPVDITFKRGGPKLIKWWGPLPGGRPRQDHNYIVSCDISRGTGNSNSVATITDVNTNEVVGIYVNPFIDVTDFAELAVALCLWAGGGTRTAYLIWEANGPGDTFSARVRKIGYNFVYYKVNEKNKIRKRSANKQYGWISSPGINGSKNDLLGALDAALDESLQRNVRFPHLIIHDIETLREMRDYIFLGDRVDVGLSSQALESSGARYAHGDRVISTAMVMLAMKEQPKASVRKKQRTRKHSMLNRMQKRREERRKAAEKTSVGKWLEN
jgi:hypothetical protein